MYIFAQHGILSIVAHRTEPGMLMVRAVAREDLKHYWPNTNIIEMADATRDVIDGVIEAYRMRRDERTGSGVRRLTVLAAVLGPLSLLAALYGVNFRDIPGIDNPGGFYIFVGVLALVAVIALVVLRRRGLL